MQQSSQRWEDTPNDEDMEVPENDPELRQDICKNKDIDGGNMEVIDAELRQDADDEEEEEEEAGKDECEDEGLGAEDGEDPSDLNDDDEYDTL